MFSVYKEGIFSEKGLIGAHKKSSTIAESLFDAQTKSYSEEDTNSGSATTSSASPYSDTTLNERGISWMDMNHSVVILGWGVDDKTGTRYWVVRNSYGPHWGMAGDFLVKRGDNDFGMEVE